MPEKIKILVIDDEADFCYFVKKNLMQHELFDVITATNGMMGIELAKNEQPDIILLDLVMPDMPGDDVAAAIKNDDVTADIPILYITALAAGEDIDSNQDQKNGSNYILPKPVRTKNLVKTILTILERP